MPGPRPEDIAAAVRPTFMRRTVGQVPYGQAPAGIPTPPSGPLPARVVVLIGNSVAQGGTDMAGQTAFAEGFPVNSRIKTWSQQLQNTVSWQPNVFTGIDPANSNGIDGDIGPDVGVVLDHLERYPDRDLILFKFTRPGSFASIGPSLGQITASIGSAGNGPLTRTAGTIAANQGLTGTGVPKGTFVVSGTDPTWFLRTIGVVPNGYNGGAVTSRVMDKYDLGLSWDVDEGSRYTGASTFGGMKAQMSAFLTKLAADGVLFEVVGTIMVLGGNDADHLIPSDLYQPAKEQLISAYRADFPIMASKKIVIPLTDMGSTYASTVRAAMGAIDAADGLVSIIPTDDIAKYNTGPHYPIAAGLGYEKIGRRAVALMEA